MSNVSAKLTSVRVIIAVSVAAGKHELPCVLTDRMGEGGVKRLYMAKCLKDLNSFIQETPKASPRLLVNSALKLLKEAELSDRCKDEERAYVLYMRFFSAVNTVQKTPEYTKEKRYYDSLLDIKTTKKVLSRAEDLQKSLQRRYEFANYAEVKEKTPEVIKEKKKDESVVDKVAEVAKPPGPSLANGVSEDDEFLSCKKLYTLMTEKCSSYIILDARPCHDFHQSHMTLPKVINVPEDILKPGLTAGKIGSQLDEDAKLVWVTQRHLVDYLILVDWETETAPLPNPLQALTHAITKWDPAKQYKSRVWVLQGGYDLWRLMYPTLTTNPRVERRTPNTTTSTIQEPVSFNFEYPDLDAAFISSAGSSPMESSASDLNVAFISSPSTTVGTKQPSDPDPGKTPTGLFQPPQINRTLKPKAGERESMDGRNNNVTINGMLEDSVSKTSLGTKVNQWDTKDSNINLDQHKTKQLYPMPDLDQNNKVKIYSNKVDNNLPSVPSRSLKPKDVLANLAAKKRELEEEKELLEESVEVEKDTIKTMEEIEATTNQRESTDDEQGRARLRETEERLQEHIRQLQAKSAAMEERQKKLQAENEEMWRLVNMALSNQMRNLNMSPAPVTSQQLEEKKKEDEDHERLRKQTEQRRALQEQVEEMRRERKEKEKKMREQAERECKLKEQRAMEAEMERKKIEERKSRIDGDIRPSRPKVTSGGETYTTKLRSSPKPSPTRGGSNLRRSHSAFDLSQQDDDDEGLGMGGMMPNFDRSLKPMVAPLKRNFNAARQRNFDPKYGSVPVSKTGLKNLGNTCYMNSVIQCLSNTTPLACYFMQGTYSNDINPTSKFRGDVAEEVGAVIRALRCGQYRSIAMWDLKNVVGRNHKPFQGYDQHDSHEFLLKLLDWLSEDLNQIHGKHPPMKEQNHEKLPDYVAADKVLEELNMRDYSIMSSLFQGLNRSKIQCGTCSHVSLTFEPFSVVSLSFPGSNKCTLRELLNHYYKDANIEYKCCKCKTMRNSIRKLDVWKLPPLLILHLNRFEHDVLMKKKQNYVDFPLDNLDLSKHVCYSNRYTKFDLYAVSNHYGTMDGGHYTAFCKSPDNKVWYKFDDHEVYEHSAVKSHAAYLLFYQASNLSLAASSFGTSSYQYTLHLSVELRSKWSCTRDLTTFIVCYSSFHQQQQHITIGYCV
ncbi:hypothetical protein Pcinc_002393 [Petrolisthes cinctipes]|uniref:ubiquitinyl hydrolase 1 n=1 Tax=Petrolisthes cinctipes TaxID=88211 RepID=A0AAE1L3I1_PETCI|nr:hypothetical protein Pcinc_002393 [Petrolisthes cinctipes]